MESDPSRSHASKKAVGADHITARPVRGAWGFLKACFGFLFWGEWNRFDVESDPVAEANPRLIPAVLQVVAGVVLGVLPFLVVDPWVESNPFWLGYSAEHVFFGSVLANVIGFGLAITLHCIAIPFLLHFKRYFVAAGIGVFYGIGVIVFLGKVILS